MLKFQPFQSIVDITFWHELGNRKINELHLSEEPVEVNGYYHTKTKDCLFQISSFEKHDSMTSMNGKLHLKNKISTFHETDKKKLLADWENELVVKINNNDILKDINQLNQFIFLCFADLKKWQFWYWFAFPALKFPQPVKLKEKKLLKDYLQHEQQESFTQLNLKEKDFAWVTIIEQNQVRFMSFLEYKESKEKFEHVLFTFIDPSSDPEVFGWPLRNLLAFIKLSFQLSECEILSLRSSHQTILETSQVLHCELPSLPSNSPAVGWERTANQKLSPKFIDISLQTDPATLITTASQLNLKLMKWRLFPTLDLELIQKQRVLILGMGTLGCYVARCLLGWGINHISMVDYGKVSYSNLVRQPLFVMDDLGKPKVEAAKENLLKILPTLNLNALEMTIPMPGHHQEFEEFEKDFDMLNQLIQNNDVIFLLMDSRESRWLPTLLCQMHDKLCLNGALGFDSYLVMRHGLSNQDLGCYFCNDVVVPKDSLSDRTLDQQCTVTRPGLAGICASLLVEFYISLLHQSDNVPHQIRAYLDPFDQMMMQGKRFPQCSACGNEIMTKIKAAKEKNETSRFIWKCCENEDFLKEMSGLLKLEEAVQQEDFDWEEEEE